MRRTTTLLLPLLLIDSLHFVFARLLHDHIHPISGALFVMGFATVEWAGYMAVKGEIRPKIFRQHAPFFLSIGFLVAASTLINYFAVGYVDAGTASLLAQMTTVYALAFGFFWFRDRFTKAEWLGAILCIIGTIVISFQPGNLLRLGSLFILGSTFMYALHAAITKRYGGEIEFSNFFLFRVATTCAFLLLFGIGSNNIQLPTTPRIWFYLALAGTVDVVISRILYYQALRILRIGIHALVLTLSPVVTIGWSLLLFGELPTNRGILGGLIVLTGIAVVSFARSRTAPEKAKSLSTQTGSHNSS